MVQVLHPIDILTHKTPSSANRCSPLTRRRTLPTARDLTFSHSWRQNALERVAVRNITAQIRASSHLSPPKPDSFSLAASQPAIILAPTVSVNHTPTFVPPSSGASAEANQVPNTPLTPLEVEDPYQAPEPQHEAKAGIFSSTTNSDALLDLTLAALHRIYIEDYNDVSWTPEPKFESQTTLAPAWPVPSRTASAYSDQSSPPSICGSSVSSAVSTPSSGLNTPCTSPEFDPEIAYQTDPGRVSTAPHSATAVPMGKPVSRTVSLPNQTRTAPPPSHSVLGDKGTLRWFLVELLRRSRASASVVQLALHYLSQARSPVGEILRQKFKSGVARDGTGQDDELKGNGNEDSPLLDPRRLLLAALMLSTKLLHDHAPNNRAWARVCGLPPRDVGACERALGQALGWKLANMFVGPQDLEPVVA